jgi:hypothetical protein
VKWVFLTICATVCAALAGFAIWTFERGGNGNERAQAHQYGRELSLKLAQAGASGYSFLGTSKIASGIWRMVYSARGKPNICLTVDLQRYRFAPPPSGVALPRGVGVDRACGESSQ